MPCSAGVLEELGQGAGLPHLSVAHTGCLARSGARSAATRLCGHKVSVPVSKKAVTEGHLGVWGESCLAPWRDVSVMPKGQTAGAEHGEERRAGMDVEGRRARGSRWRVGTGRGSAVWATWDLDAVRSVAWMGQQYARAKQALMPALIVGSALWRRRASPRVWEASTAQGQSQVETGRPGSSSGCGPGLCPACLGGQHDLGLCRRGRSSLDGNPLGTG